MGTKTRLKITPNGVWFNNKEVEIDDSSNMTYVFENEAHRTLRLRWIGTEDKTALPIWEFTVEYTHDNMWVIGPTGSGKQFVGYGEWIHEGNTLSPAVKLSVAA